MLHYDIYLQLETGSRRLELLWLLSYITNTSVLRASLRSNPEIIGAPAIVLSQMS